MLFFFFFYYQKVQKLYLHDSYFLHRAYILRLITCYAFSIYNISFELKSHYIIQKKKKKQVIIPNLNITIYFQNFILKPFFCTYKSTFFYKCFSNSSSLRYFHIRNTFFSNNTLNTSITSASFYQNMPYSSSPILHTLHYSKLSSINSPSYPCNCTFTNRNSFFQLIPLAYLFSHSIFISFLIFAWNSSSSLHSKKCALEFLALSHICHILYLHFCLFDELQPLCIFCCVVV